ncbi:MAG: Thioredoxin [Actinomycetota bacterium]|jgi:thiol-disulfide isomerase/thioredoxin|nr:Thioredoxin [Actinomycetota bacterium]
MIPLRLLVVVVLALGVLLVARRFRQWRSTVRTEMPATPLIPLSIRAGAERTWVIFTTPFCASCGPIEARLRAEEPDANVVRIDATEEPQLSNAFKVRSAPTVLLADGDGRVQARLVGAEAFERYVRNPA